MGLAADSELRLRAERAEQQVADLKADRAFGSVFTRRIQAMGIRDRPTSFRSLWQNGRVERLIGSIRRRC